MNVIQVLLIGGIVAVFGWLLLNPRSQQVHAWIKILVAAFTAFGVVVILSPSTSDRIAHAVGVGRGADLLLYSLAVSFVYVVLSLYTRSKDEQEKFEKIARSIALMDARVRELNDLIIETREQKRKS